MEEKNRFYTYKDNIYYSFGADEARIQKVKNPETGEWFDAINYHEVEFFTKDGEEDVKYFRTYGGNEYYREVNDFKKKFKKLPKSKQKGWKEIY